MPNWVENDLVVYAKSKKALADLKKFKKFAFTKDKYPDDKEDKDLPIDFEKFVPYPDEYYEDVKEQEEIERLKKEGKIGQANKLEILYKLKEHKELFGGNDWRIVNWGTKWNARFYQDYQTEPRDKGNILIYNFSTAWSSPLPVVLKMSELFPNLLFKIKYYEGAMGFSGTFECKNNVVIRDIFKVIAIVDTGVDK